MPEILNGLSSWFEINMGLSADTQLKILWTLAVLSILFLTHYVICFLFSVRVKDAARRYTLRKTMTMALSTAGLVFFSENMDRGASWSGGLSGNSLCRAGHCHAGSSEEHCRLAFYRQSQTF